MKLSIFSQSPLLRRSPNVNLDLSNVIISSTLKPDKVLYLETENKIKRNALREIDEKKPTEKKIRRRKDGKSSVGGTILWDAKGPVEIKPKRRVKLLTLQMY